MFYTALRFLMLWGVIGLSFPVIGVQSGLQQEPIVDLVVSGNGEVLGIHYGSQIVELVDASTGELLDTIELSTNPRQLTLSPTGDRFIWTDGGAGIYLYAVDAQTNLTLVPNASEIGGEGISVVGTLAWNPVNDTLAITGGSGVAIYTIGEGELSSIGDQRTFLLDESSGRIVLGVWNASGNFFATSHYSQNTLDPTIESRALQIWKVLPGEVQDTPIVYYNERAGGAIAWSPDGTQLALLGSHELIIYDLEGDAFTHELMFDEQHPATVVWNPTGAYLATGGMEIRVWDTTTWEVVGTLPADVYVSAIQWSPDCHYLYSNRSPIGLSINANPALEPEG